MTSNTNCCVPNCHSKRSKNPELSFHCFPKEKDKRKVWQTALKLGKPISDALKVCSRHFSKQDFFFISDATKRPRLKLGVVPNQNLPLSSVKDPIKMEKKKISALEREERHKQITRKKTEFEATQNEDVMSKKRHLTEDHEDEDHDDEEHEDEDHDNEEHEDEDHGDERRFHPGGKIIFDTDTNNILCILCDEECGCIPNFHRHLSEKHEIELCHEKKTFNCEDDFHKWKEQIEKDIPCQFIVSRSKKELPDGWVHYKCNRGGIYKPSGNRKRQFEKSGTQKIGYMCPAYISMYKSVMNEAVEIEVDFQSVHVGHEADMWKIGLTPAEKSHLTEALGSGKTKSTIIIKLQKEFSPNKRICPTSRKDLHNIAQSFCIKDTFSLGEIQDDREFRNLKVQNIIKENFNPAQNTVTNASLENDKNALKMEVEEIFNACKSVEHLRILKQSIHQVKAQYQFLELDSYPFS